MVLFLQRKLDNANDPVNILHHIAIPKTNDFITQRLKILCSFRIIFSLVYVLTAIEFDNEFLFDAAEIGDVVSNRVLPSEVHP